MPTLLNMPPDEYELLYETLDKETLDKLVQQHHNKANTLD